MSIWNKVRHAVEEARRRTLGAVLDALAERKARADDAAFSIALIALSAKMARADGAVTDDEVAAFQSFFKFGANEADKVRMIFSLAQQDVAGFEHYLAQVARIYKNDPAVLEDVLDCLYHVALADKVAHPRELDLLDQAAETFGLAGAVVRRLKAAHLGVGADDPYLILGIAPEIDDAALKQSYRALVRECHPDALIARGLPVELIDVADRRMAVINAAYEQIRSERAA